MFKNCKKWLTFSPLLLLLFLFFTEKIKFFLPAYVLNPEVSVIRYFVIPLVGFSIGATLFLFLLRWHKFDEYTEKLNQFTDRNEKRFLLYSGGVFLIFSLVLVILRYFTFHLFLFDFGVYDIRIWQISQASWMHKLEIASTGHFQPILIVFSFIYNIFDHPWILLFLQVLITLSGAIPLYLISKKKIKNSLLIVGIVILYFFYPPVAFNIFCDFHPDHIYIPLLFWAFYFIDERKYIKSSPFLLLLCTLKEPLILGVAFLGIYIALAQKRYILGILVFLIFSFLFYEITLNLLSKTTFKEETILQTNAFSYLGTSSILGIIKEVLKPSKLRFLFFVFYPFLFLPFLRPKELIPAVPFLIIPLLSLNPHHQNVASQYTAGIIAPVFVALVILFSLMINRWGKRVTFSLLFWMLVSTLTLNIAQSPLPLSVAFWDKKWSFGNWHYSNYLWSEHQHKFKTAVALIPKDPEVRVVIHSGTYHKDLFHRYCFDCFPYGLEKADFVILDNSRGFIIGDTTVEKEKYFSYVDKMQKSGLFKMLYNDDQIQVYKHN